MNRFIVFPVALFVCCLGQSAAADNIANNKTINYYPASMDKETQKLLSKSVQALINDAVQHLKNDEVVKATTLLWGAITLSPNDVRAYEGLANIFWSYQQYNKFYRLIERSMRFYVDADYFIPKLAQQSLANPGYIPPADKVYIAEFKNGARAAYSFMFDDGERNVATHILPIFDEYGFKATIPINPGETYEGNKNKWRGSWEQWKNAVENGHEIANHTWSHQTIVGANELQLEQQISKSYDLIEEKLGISPRSFVFPLNETDAASVEFAQKRHFALRDPQLLSNMHMHTFMPVYGGKFFSKDTANLIVDWAMHQGMWIVPVCHGIVTEDIENSYKPVTEEMLRSHLDYLTMYSNDIWVAPFGEVYSYLYARNHTEVQVLEESDSGMVVKLIRSSPPGDMQTPLTIIFDPNKEITSVKAVMNAKERLPAKISGGKVLVDVPFKDVKVLVSWK